MVNPLILTHQQGMFLMPSRGICTGGWNLCWPWVESSEVAEIGLEPEGSIAVISSMVCWKIHHLWSFSQRPKPPWLGHGDFPASHRFMAGGYKLGNPRTWLRPAGKIIERNGGCSRKQCLIAGGYPEFLNCGWIWWIIHLFFRKCECMKLYDHKQWGSLFMGPHRFIGSSLARYSNPQIDSR